MKKLIYGGLLLALVGIGFTSCEKEEILKDNSTSKVEDAKDLPQKSGFSNPTTQVTSLAQAANLEEIKYDHSSEKYKVTSHDYTTNFEITVDYFNVNNESKFVINDASTNTEYEVTINIENGILSISELGEYSKESFPNGISTDDNIIVRIAAVFAPYHEILGNKTTFFSDNGDTDIFGPFPPARPFIGTTEDFGPCDDLLKLQNKTTKTYIFWIEVGSHTELVPC
ncbi:hypothetical protein [Brumimicrobium aurantiacum]|nr:hypothetical protein [Brumimicrobium aurantiacum]